ncbi:MAG: type IV toxin-antitoxin system AbiEi family antitoxin [bacterium]
MKTLKEHILYLLSQGKYFFSKHGTMLELAIDQSQFRYQAYRLSKKGFIKKLDNNFFMIIPAEYQQLGTLPPHWIVDAFMKHLNQAYYIGLLSAASLYGSTEQQPMTFQVITNKMTKKIELGRSEIEFFYFKDCSASIKAQLTVPTGYVNISTKEQTIVDLVRFYKVSGYMSNVALVIKSLSQECEPSRLADVIEHEKNKSVLQRLGYILEFVEQSGLANIIEKELSARKMEYILLRPDCGNKDGEKVSRWKIVINDTLDLQ